jgi:hypothetical protein
MAGVDQANLKAVSGSVFAGSQIFCMQVACTFSCKMVLFCAISCKTAWSQAEEGFSLKSLVTSSYTDAPAGIEPAPYGSTTGRGTGEG